MKAKQGIKTGLILGLTLLLFGSCKEEELYTIEEYTKLACTFHNKSIPNGQSVIAYSAESLVYDTKCTSVAETRTCNDGELSGTFKFNSCVEEPPATCTFDNKTVAHTGFVEAYSSSSREWNESCGDVKAVRTCDNGTLSNIDHVHPTCTVKVADNCTFNSQLVEHLKSVKAWEASSVSYGNSCVFQDRSCTNGQLSGNYTATSCSVAAADNCSVSGVTVQHNLSETFYQNSSVPFGSSCQSQSRTCLNGNLSGNYTATACSTASAANCSYSDGGSAVHSLSTYLTNYSTGTSDWPATCADNASSVICNNGNFSQASYSYQFCNNGPPDNCSLKKPGNAGLSNVIHGDNITAYSSQSVIFGNVCDSVKTDAMCYDSNFVNPSNTSTVLFASNTYYDNCSVGAPSGCNLIGISGDNVSYSHDADNSSAVKGYTTNQVTFGNTCPASVDLFCNNGDLKLANGTLNTVGGYNYDNCTVGAASQCTWFGANVNHGDNVTAYKFNSSAGSNSCSGADTENRTCNNGTFSGSFAYNNCLNESILVGARYNSTSTPEKLEFTTIPLDINGNYYQEKDNITGNLVNIGIGEIEGSIRYGGTDYAINFSGNVDDEIVSSSISLVVAVVIDSSQSMATLDNGSPGYDVGNLRYTALKELVKLLPVGTILDVRDLFRTESSGNWIKNQTLTDNKSSILSTIDTNMSSSDLTPLWQNMDRGALYLSGKNQTRLMLITLTDGFDDGAAARYTKQGVIDLLNSASPKIELHNIGLGPEVASDFKSMPNSVVKGGSYRNVDNASGLQELFTNLGKTTSIGYATPKGVPVGLNLVVGETYTMTITVRGISQTINFVR